MTKELWPSDGEDKERYDAEQERKERDYGIEDDDLCEECGIREATRGLVCRWCEAELESEEQASD